MAKLYHVELTESERTELASFVNRRKSQSRFIKRSYVLLAADEKGDKGWTDERISQVYNVSTRAIERWRKRYVEEGLQIAIYGRPKVYEREKLFDGRVESHLVALRCSDPPSGYNKWTLRLLASQMVELEYVEQMSYESVRQILKKRNQTLEG